MDHGIVADRLDRLGPESLTDAELVALMLRCAPDKVPALSLRDLAKEGFYNWTCAGRAA